MMMDAMKAENEKLAAAGGGGEGDSKLQEMLAAKQAELMVRLFGAVSSWLLLWTFRFRVVACQIPLQDP